MWGGGGGGRGVGMKVEKRVVDRCTVGGFGIGMGEELFHLVHFLCPGRGFSRCCWGGGGCVSGCLCSTGSEAF